MTQASLGFFLHHYVKSFKLRTATLVILKKKKQNGGASSCYFEHQFCLRTKPSRKYWCKKESFVSKYNEFLCLLRHHSIGKRQLVHSAVQCGVLCLCRFMQFTGCDQPVQHSHWPEHAIDWLP